MRVPLGTRAYEIHLGDGIRDDIPRLLREFCPAASYTVISDSTVAPLYGEPLSRQLDAMAPSQLLTFPAGEEYKNRDTWSTLIDQLLAAGLLP